MAITEPREDLQINGRRISTWSNGLMLSLDRTKLQTDSCGVTGLINASGSMVNRHMVTLDMIDELHQAPAGSASESFRQNREQFVEGEDFFTADSGSYLFTEAGYVKIIQPFDDDLSWRVHREFVNSYGSRDILIRPASGRCRKAYLGVEGYRGSRIHTNILIGRIDTRIRMNCQSWRFWKAAVTAARD